MLSKFIRSFVLFGALVSAPTIAYSQAQPALTRQQTNAIDAAVRDYMDREKAVGLAVGVIRNGRVAYLNGYGYADLENKKPVTANTLFRWASISKTLTAVTALQLAEQQKLDLEKDVRTYVPEFPDKGDPITSKQLLCHQSGIPHYDRKNIIVTKRAYETEHPFEDVVTGLDNFKETPLLFSPGEKFHYSSHAYMLLSAVVERAGEERFADQVQNRIANPLGLKTLQPDYQWIPNPEKAKGYKLHNGEVVASSDTDVSWKLGGGGFMSNIGDLALFAQGLIGSQILSDAAKNFAWQPQVTGEGEETTFGFGFEVSNKNSNLRISHSGSQEKARTRMVIYPKQGHGVVVMSNSENVEPGDITSAIYAVLK